MRRFIPFLSTLTLTVALVQEPVERPTQEQVVPRSSLKIDTVKRGDIVKPGQTAIVDTDATYVSRPAEAQSETASSIFVFESDGRHAVRRQVALGVNALTMIGNGEPGDAVIEVRSGLKPGDVVIVSDMSAVAQFDRVLVQ
jgi:hypothetical protein